MHALQLGCTSKIPAAAQLLCSFGNLHPTLSITCHNVVASMLTTMVCIMSTLDLTSHICNLCMTSLTGEHLYNHLFLILQRLGSRRVMLLAQVSSALQVQTEPCHMPPSWWSSQYSAAG